jgi:hypothetical protein
MEKIIPEAILPMDEITKKIITDIKQELSKGEKK